MTWMRCWQGGLLVLMALANAAEAQVQSNLAARMEPVASILERPARLEVHDVPLEQALIKLYENSGVPVSFSPSLLPENVAVSCACPTATVREALNRLLENTGLHYREIAAVVLIVDVSAQPEITRDRPPVRYAALDELAPLPPTSRMRVATLGTITGRVSDAATQQPLSGASVSIIGTQLGTLTDPEGRFSLSGVPPGTHGVRANMIGYAPLEQTVEVVDGQIAVVNFAMEAEAVTLEGVVAVGYGTQRRRDVTGAVTSINAEEATDAVPIASVQQAIQGRVAGVQITQSSSEPGGGVRIRVRGAGSINASNDPLYVIDGLPISDAGGVTSNSRQTLTERNPLNALNPNDIASIEILKDAAATAIYGARGANGVVLITTKRGSAGETRIDYEGYAGMQQVANKIDVLNAQEYMQVLNDIRTDQGLPAEFSSEELAASGTGTDWQEEIMRSAPMQSHQLSFSGGSETNRYFASFGYLGQEGVVRGSGMDRYTGRLNSSHERGDLRFGVNLNSSVIEDDFAPGGIGINMASGAIFAALQVPPTLSIRDSNGDFTDPQNDINNPVAIIEGIEESARTTRIFGNLYGEYDLQDWLTARVNVGTDRFNIRHDTYESRLTLNGAGAGGIADARSVEGSSDLAELTLTLNRTFADRHNLTLLGGTTYQIFRNRSFGASTQGFPSDVTGVDNLALGAAYQRPSSSRSSNQLLSYLGRLNYDYEGRYLATLSLRADGSSRFGEENRFGYFPSVALGWRLSDEPFLRNAPFLNDLKLRLSYGVTGNQEIGNYRSLLLLGTGATSVLGETPVVGTEPSRIPNPALKWERTTQLNLGTDFTLFDNRLSGSVELYRKDTEDLLLDFPLPLSTGFGFITRNAGAVRNEGIELTLNTINLEGPLKWESGLTFSTLRNRVLDLAGAREAVIGGVGWVPDFALVREGAPIGAYFGYQVDGIVQEGETVPGRSGVTPAPGDLKVRDVNGDGVITADDRMIIGSPFPEFTFGLTNTFSYGPLSLSVFVQGVQGQEIFNATWTFSDSPINFVRNRLAEPYLNRWTPSNPTNEHPSFVDPSSWAGNTVNSRAVQDASYIRLQNVTLTYDLPSSLLGDLTGAASVYVSGQNLVTFTDYSGYNPDVSVRGSSNFLVDMSAYPLARIITAGMSLRF